MFTADDFKNVVWPHTIFAMCAALSGPLLTTNATPKLSEILIRLPKVFIWIWLNLLVGTISNQRLPSSALEDAMNKPWRPIAAGRITSDDARQLLMGVIPLTLLVSWSIGGLRESAAVIIMCWMYNDLGGADEHHHIRNLINALALSCFNSGAAIVAIGHGEHALNDRGYSYLVILAAMIFSTIATQDMPDMPGDATRGRKTLPLVYGHVVARWVIAIPILFWSLICPAFLDTDISGYMFSLLLGSIFAFHLLAFRTNAADKVSWKMWSVWALMLFSLPLFKNHEVFVLVWKTNLRNLRI
jgi:4-hydroxybenzoate polyprenyltransferase